jgi:putative N6-adenine-specific DNA methylase
VTDGAGAWPLYAVTAPGLEALTARELAGLGIQGAVEAGGVSWDGTAEQLYRANLALRTASRVLLRLGEFRARTFPELERHAAGIPWGRVLAPGRPVAFRVTCRKSRLYHEGAVAERLLRAAVAAGGTPAAEPRDAEEVEGEAAQLFVVRFHRDVCQISADTTGALLHLRGYRQAVGRAPLRETLAAALLDAAGWDAAAPLVDPFCGSGTIPIEAALRARRIAPGLAGAERRPRAYAFEEWPAFDGALWERVVVAARAEILPAAAGPILGSDRDAGAIAAARSNAERAGVAGDIDFVRRPLSARAAPPGPGWLVSNPPYGVRVGERERLRDLYAAVGHIARERLPGWTVALLSGSERLDARTELGLEEILRTRNGGIPVRLVAGRVGGPGAGGAQSRGGGLPVTRS